MSSAPRSPPNGCRSLTAGSGASIGNVTISVPDSTETVAAEPSTNSLLTPYTTVLASAAPSSTYFSPAMVTPWQTSLCENTEIMRRGAT